MRLDRFVFDFSVNKVVDREGSIAVLHFANRSELDSDLYLVDDILTLLANLTGLEKIVSRTSVERFRETTLGIPEIGRALDGAHVLRVEPSHQPQGFLIAVPAPACLTTAVTGRLADLPDGLRTLLLRWV
jgi:hypothetical protein